MMIEVRVAALAVAGVCVMSACGAAEANPTAAPSPSASPAVLDDRPLEAQLRDAISQADLALVSLVLDAGVDVNADFGQSVTPLMSAVMRQDPVIAQTLLDAGAEVNALSAQGLTALHMAVQYDHAPLVTMLLEAGSDVTIEGGTPTPFPPLHLSARNDNTAAMGAMLEFGVSADQATLVSEATPLMLAAWWDAPGCARLLVEYGADYNAVDEDGNTVLDFARLNRSEAVVAYLESIGAAEAGADND